MIRRYCPPALAFLAIWFFPLAALTPEFQTDSIPQAKISARLENARKLILNKDLASADSLLHGLSALQSCRGESNFYLGLVILADERTNRSDLVDRAGKYFVAAAEDGYQLPPGAWDNYPLTEKRFIDANWTAAEKLLKKKDTRSAEVAGHLLENIVVLDPQAYHAGEELGKLYLDNGKVRQAIDLFLRLLAAEKDQDKPLYLAGLGFMDIYYPEKAAIFLDTLSGGDSKDLSPLLKLFMAQALFVLQDNRIACSYYFQSLKELDETTALEAHRDLQDIITDKEQKEYEQARTLEEKRVFFRKFWKSRDPSPVTEYDERLVEHYRRLNYSKLHYHVYLNDGYDDRGRIYIKHGEPDQKVSLPGDYDWLENETWQYLKKPDNLLFHFVRRGMSFYIVPSILQVIKGGTGGRLIELLQSREEFDPLYFRATTGEFDEGDFRFEEAKITEHAITTGEKTETYTPYKGVQPFNYYYYTADFMSVDANSNVNVYYGLPVRELEFDPDSLGFSYGYETTFAVFDKEWNEVKRVYDHRTNRLVHEPDKNNRGELLVDRQVLNLPPGDYHYSASVKDLNSDHLGIYNGDLAVTPYERNKFNMSQIVLASKITRAAPGQKPGRFARGDLNVMPLPSRTFRRDQPVFIYFEIYFLSGDSEGKKRYNIDFAIEADKLSRNLASKMFSSFGKLLSSKEDKNSITLTFDKEQTDPERMVQVEYISVDIADSPPGWYGLNITVTDAASGAKIGRQTKFMIVQP